MASSTPTPITLPARFQIRRLEPKHHDWVKAIFSHTNIFHSPLWPVVYPDNKTARTYRLFQSGDYAACHSIDSGLSYGVFDTEYKFKRPESKAEGGRLYWNFSDTNATGEELLEQMDFPLVSTALSYDGANPLDMSQMAPMVQALPLFATLLGVLEAGDKRDPASWKAKALGEVLMRSGTCTREDYKGMGIARGVAHWLMWEAKGKGFRGVQIETAHAAMEKVWMNPPGDFKAEMVSWFECEEYEEEGEGGGKVKVFEPCRLKCTKIYVSLV